MLVWDITIRHSCTTRMTRQFLRAVSSPPMVSFPDGALLLPGRMQHAALLAPTPETPSKEF